MAASKTVNQLALITNAADGDRVPIYDASSGQMVAITILNLQGAFLGSYLRKDGTEPLTGDWDIGDGRKVLASEIRARSAAGLRVANTSGQGVLIGSSGNAVFDGNITLSNNKTVDGVDVSALGTSVTSLSSSVTNHLNNADVHRVINDATTGVTVLWSASKINGEIANHAANNAIHRSIDDTTTGVTVLWSASKINGEIVAHTGNAAIHRSINDSSTSTTTLWSASKISSEIAAVAGAGGGDADTLDGINSTEFARRNSANTFSAVNTFNAYARFLGTVSSSAQNTDRIDIGVQAGTPRMILEDAGYTPIAFDCDKGHFRIYDGTGVMKIYAKQEGLVGIGNNFSPAAPLHVYRSNAGSVSVPGETVIMAESGGFGYLTLATPTNTGFAIRHVTPSSSNSAQIGFFHFSTGLSDMRFELGGTARAILTPNQFAPAVDQGLSAGTAAARFSSVWAATGTIQTSDENDKRDIVDSDLGLDFVRALRPVRGRWRNVDLPELTETRTEKRKKMQTVMREVEEEVEEEGVIVRRTVQREVEEPVMREVAVVDAEGEPLIEEVEITLMDSEGGQPKLRKDGEPITRMQRRQAKRAVPVMEEVEITEVTRPAVKRQHQRLHYWLLAQQVKQVMDELGIEDFAGYIDPSVGGETGAKGLRYSEFVPVLVKSDQELYERDEQILEMFRQQQTMIETMQRALAEAGLLENLPNLGESNERKRNGGGLN